MIKYSILALLLLVGSSTAIKNDTDIFLGEDHVTGFIPLNEGKDDMFYWLIRSRQSTKDQDPLTIWLTGGPGCSSVLALFTENGPFYVNDNITLSKNVYSWNDYSNVLYVDQPVGTGYSHASMADYTKNEDEIAADFYQFFIGFLEKYPEYKKRDLYITGESYAGHYVPAISAYLQEKSKNNTDINLVAFAIGNGLVDAYSQYPQYAEFAYENKLIGTVQYKLLQPAFKLCQQMIKSNLGLAAFYECQIAMETILGLPTAPRFNVYDIREKCEHPPLCYDFSNVDKFLARSDVIDALGVKGRKWTECNQIVHIFLLFDYMPSLTQKVAYLLESGVKGLVYSGDKDFICNWRGGEAWTHDLEWAHKQEFQNATYSDWMVNGKAAGQIKSANGLTFLRVFDAGHMVPRDQPEVSLHMLTDFFQKWSLEKKLQVQ